jgi:hypothetical protein
MGFSDNIRRRVSFDLLCFVRAFVLRGICSRLLDLRVLRSNVFDLHGRLRPGLQFMRFELRDVVRSGLLNLCCALQLLLCLQQLRHATSNAPTSVRLRLVRFNVCVRLRLLGRRCRSCTSFVRGTGDHLPSASSRRACLRELFCRRLGAGTISRSSTDDGRPTADACASHFDLREPATTNATHARSCH